MGLTKKLVFGLIVISSSFAISCSEKKTLGQVDLEVFRSDRGGCKNLRQSDIDNLEAIQDSLLGKSENEIIDLLGRYDVQVLDSRQRKMFVYYLEQSIQCEDIKSPGYGRTMVLRFNAVSLVNEINFQIGLP